MNDPALIQRLARELRITARVVELKRMAGVDLSPVVLRLVRVMTAPHLWLGGAIMSRGDQADRVIFLPRAQIIHQLTHEIALTGGNRHAYVC